MDIPDELKDMPVTAQMLREINQAIVDSIDDARSSVIALASALVRKGLLTDEDIRREAEDMFKVSKIPAQMREKTYHTLDLLSRFALPKSASKGPAS